MLTSVDDLAGKSIKFTIPVAIDKLKYHYVYAALNSNHFLVESPKLLVKKAQDVSPFLMIFSVKDDKFFQLLEHVDGLIQKDAQKYRKDYEMQKSVKDDEFQAKLLGSTKSIETKVFMSNKKEAEPKIESKSVNKILQDACVRLICRLDGYSIDSAKELIRPVWVIQQCLISNQTTNPIGTEYCFLDDGDDLSYFSE